MKLYKVNRKIWEELPERIMLCSSCQQRYHGKEGFTFICDSSQPGRCTGCGNTTQRTGSEQAITINN